MSGCDKVLPLLNDYVDGELSPEEARAAQEHLASCPGCAAALDELHLLLARAADLPREIAPPQDLWRGVEGRIRAPELGPSPRAKRIPGWILAAAAALVVVVGASGLLLRRPVPHGDPGPAPGVAYPLVQPAGLMEMDRDYGRAKADLLRVLGERRDLLRPETRAVVDENLALVDQAVRHLRGALEKDPANRALMDLLKTTYRQEQELLKRAATLPANA